jgi:hypothetical protein
MQLFILTFILFCLDNGERFNHHHLLKSSNHFHRNSDHPEFKGKWMFICPVCGSDPSAAELRAKRGVYEIKDHNFSYEDDDDF